MEYIFKKGNTVNVIQYKKKGANSKLGASSMLQTYHFSVSQILSGSLEDDKEVCFDCPLSYNAGDGKCYTHKGLQRLGLLSMMKRLKKLYEAGDVSNWNASSFSRFYTQLKGKEISLVRFGTYGEPVILDVNTISILANLGKSWTGYTHQWNKDKYRAYSAFFMASTHSQFEAAIAQDLGWRVFNTGDLNGAVNCPASKEAGRKSTCTVCALCSGTSGKGKKDIYIGIH